VHKENKTESNGAVHYLHAALFSPFALLFCRFYLLRSTRSLYEIPFAVIHSSDSHRRRLLSLFLVRPGPTRNIYCELRVKYHNPTTRFPMPTFDLVVVGSGGGPFETNLSSFVCCVTFLAGHMALPNTDTYSSHVTYPGQTE